MTGYLVRRLLGAALVLVLTSIFVFLLFFVGLGDAPADQACQRQLKQRCTVEISEAYAERMGLRDPVVTNYLTWAGGLVRDRTITTGDGKQYECPAPCLGLSTSNGNALVTEELGQKLPATVVLAVGGAAIYVTLGVVAGTVAARRRGTLVDRGLMSGTLLVSAIPYYLVALLAWIYLTQRTSIFPTTGYVPISEDPLGTVKGLLLPWLVLGLTGATAYARITRGQLVEVLGEDYIRTAAAKGLRTNRVVYLHGLRAAIVPVVTIFGLDFAGLLAGAAFTEQIFGIDGIGRWALGAVRAPLDFNVISATVLVAAALIVVANLAVDLLYTVLDPRVRLR